MTMHFLSLNDVYGYFSKFKQVYVEKSELTSLNNDICHSDWLITVVK